MDGKPEKTEGGSPGQKPEAWNYSDSPALRRLLDHIAEEIATKWIRRLKEAGIPDEQESGEKGDRS